jgi:hypothetical protein
MNEGYADALKIAAKHDTVAIRIPHHRETEMPDAGLILSKMKLENYFDRFRKPENKKICCMVD